MLLISKDWDSLFLWGVQCNGLGYVLLLLLLDNYYYTVYCCAHAQQECIARVSLSLSHCH